MMTPEKHQLQEHKKTTSSGKQKHDMITYDINFLKDIV